jgi:SSS family solute:Na+ symporter
LHTLDIVLLVVYFVGILGIGLWFLRKNENAEDYYVGGRSIGPAHIGLSVVATDVGGGFSIGLGGLGFAMGLSGSWMLFTGFIGAYLTAIILIPKVHALGTQHKLTTYPQIFGVVYGKRVAIAAAVVSAIGYIGFTASQLLAGAKLASASIPALDVPAALLAMGALAVLYTAMGGMKAVIYTDTVQWILLMVGLIFIGLPICYQALGGMDAIVEALPPEHLRLDQVSGVQLTNWMFTIVPIWFVGMTLYQRIYASRDVKSARRAWFIAGCFEWPIMAFLGVVLGMLGRVAWQGGFFESAGYPADVAMDGELGLPLLLANLLPIGFKGLMLAAYFSAILSTADSCLMAASGNLTTDLFPDRRAGGGSARSLLFRSQAFTLVIGAAALLLAWRMENVLGLMLHSYAFMVSGLLVPTLAALFLRCPTANAALAAMFAGGGTTLTLILVEADLPLGLDANIFGITASVVAYFGVSALGRR